MRWNNASAVIAALLGIFSLSIVAFAQEDCPRGTLDKAYCDRNGDLVADLPTDPKKVVDPQTLIFSYTPVEDPAVYQKVWDGFIKHLEKTTGKRVVFFPVQSMQRNTKPCARGGCTSQVSTREETRWQ
jgi:phosphonate transport system substrate-binding protein